MEVFAAQVRLQRAASSPPPPSPQTSPVAESLSPAPHPPKLQPDVAACCNSNPAPSHKLRHPGQPEVRLPEPQTAPDRAPENLPTRTPVLPHPDRKSTRLNSSHLG